jgi:hypothetical protein
MQLNMGFNGQATTAGYPWASVPAAAGATPQGPRTIGQQAFGIVGGDTQGGNVPLYAVIGGGGFALAALVFIWWSLPR